MLHPVLHDFYLSARGSQLFADFAHPDGSIPETGGWHANCDEEGGESLVNEVILMRCDDCIVSLPAA